ncbi:hypothetical protein DFJ74DRAFT_74062 [Hyaloraphidium curvatum]|nr:hypothetical protein DFJ74DRAFT_74062 [Hyaloraphidium curvatum]
MPQTNSAPRQARPQARISTSRPQNAAPSARGGKEPRRDAPPSLLPPLAPTTAHALLKCLHAAFEPTFASPSYVPTLRQIKSFFAARQYEKIFGPGAEERERLAVYAADYAGGRAVGYCELWAQEDSIRSVFRRALRGRDSVGAPSRELRQHTRILCLGAGTGAEAVAAAGILLRVLEDMKAAGTDIGTGAAEGKSTDESSTRAGQGEKELLSAAASLTLSDGGPSNASNGQPLILDAPAPSISITCADYADYSAVFSTVESSLYASFGELYSVAAFHFERADLLAEATDPASSRLDELLSGADLITLNFTLNELLAQSKSRTAAFLQRLTSRTKPGAILATIDSAGSFSDLELSSGGGEGKVYPAPMLLLLLSRGPFWEEVSARDGEWWRLPKAEREDVEAWYPARIEDFRCFIRVLRRRDA